MRLVFSPAVLATFALIAAAGPAIAVSVDDKTAQKQAEIPNCSHKIGTLGIHEPQNNWWGPLGLESPEALLKVFVMKSGCFTLLDRGQGFAMAQQERALASGGQLQQGSNVGMGQVRAADYVLVPDVVNRNGNASGTNVGGILGGFIGGGVGALVSNISSKTVDVVLTVTNVRTSEQQAMEEGHSSQTDVGIGFGGGWGGWGGFGGAGISNYQNTAIGQVVVLAYIDAYTKLVSDLGGLSAQASADAPAQAVTMSRPGRLYTTASEKSKTGNKDGVWWEVKDELGNQGWVSSINLTLSK